MYQKVDLCGKQDWNWAQIKPTDQRMWEPSTIEAVKCNKEEKF